MFEESFSLTAYGLVFTIQAYRGIEKKDSNCRIIENNYKTKHPFQIFNLEKKYFIVFNKSCSKGCFASSQTPSLKEKLAWQQPGSTTVGQLTLDRCDAHQADGSAAAGPYRLKDSSQTYFGVKTTKRPRLTSLCYDNVLTI